MMKILKIGKEMFIYWAFSTGIPFTIVCFIYSGNIVKSLVAGFMLGFLGASFMTPLLMITLILFQKRWLLYNNINKHFEEQNVHEIIYESVAANVNGLKRKHGALFLSKNTLLFVPHRLTFKSFPIILSVEHIKSIKKAGKNLWKFLLGIRWSFDIEMKDGSHYEFNAWHSDTNTWVCKIESLIKSDVSD